MKFFGTLRQKKTGGKNSDFPFLCIKFFHTRIFLKHRRITPWKFSALWDKKIDNLMTPLLSKCFSIPEHFWNTRVPPIKFFDTVELKFFDGRSCYPPGWKSWYPPHAKKNSIPEFLSKRHGSLTKFCGKMTQKIFRRRIIIPPPPLMHKIFRYPRFCERPKGSLANLFAIVRQKISDGKAWSPPPYP